MSQITTRISGSGPGAFVQTLTGNSGGPVGPTGGNINVLGTGVITVVGNPGTSTLTITPSGSIASSFVTNPATGTATPAAGVLTFAGTGGIVVSAGGSTVTIDGSGISAGTITGNTGGPQAQTAGNWNIVTANSTVVFAGAASTLTQDFGLRNLFLGVVPPLAGGDENVAIGFSAGQSITSGIANVIIGFDAGTNLTNGTSNVIIGDAAMSSSGANTDECVAIGANALQNFSGSSGNTAVGFQALIALVNGSNNAALGIDAGSNYNGSESDNIVILNNGQNGENGVTRIGTNGNQLACYIAGIDGVDVGSVATVVTEAGDQLGTAVLTAGTGVTITPGPNTITISAASAVAESFPTDSGTATPSAGILNIFGDSHSVTTTGSGNTVTVGLTGVTQYNVQTGGASNALNNVAPTATSGVPLISQGAASQPIFGTAVVAGGGTGAVTLTNHGVLLGQGTSAIVATAVGTTGQVLTGVTGADPVWASPAASSISITGDSGGALTGNAFTFTGGTTGLTFSGAVSTETLTGTLVVANGGTGRATLTNHGLLVGAGTSAITQLAAATNGQLPIGSTGADPVLATISSGNNITVTNGAGTISVAVTGTTNHAIQIGNASGSLTSLAAATNGQIPIGSTGADPVIAAITAGTGISVTNGAGSITIASTATAFAWSVISADQTAAVNNGYFCNKASTLALALPTTSAVGDVIEVTNENTALGVQFTQASGQQILIGSSNTTLGATGTLTSSAVGDTLKIVCKTANTIWRVTSMVGNWSVV